MITISWRYNIHQEGRDGDFHLWKCRITNHILATWLRFQFLCLVTTLPTIIVFVVNLNCLDDSLKISEFRNYCTEHVSDEYFLEELASHSFFNHEFINIYTFLVELPAKSEEEKSAFFEYVWSKKSLFILFVFNLKMVLFSEHWQ